VYIVETDEPAQHQVDGLPTEALAAYLDLRVMLETAPWNGAPYNRANPDGAMRTQTFGSRGLVVYLILENQRRVILLSVQWAG